MANRCVYLHETIDIVGTGSEPYKAHTGRLGTNRTDGGAPLVGTWQQSGSTGSWPTVVNLWEMRDWDHWAEILARQYTATSGQEPKLKRWWSKATEYRSGGFDRILEPTPFSPTREELIAEGVRGAVVVQEVTTVKPGKAERYLDAVAARYRPVVKLLGLTLLGAYTTAMRDTEAILLWSVPTFAAFTRHLAAVRTSATLRRWMEHARQWRTDYRQTLLVPSPWCVTHPEWLGAARPRRGRTSRRGL
jgi:hypothetical protein